MSELQRFDGKRVLLTGAASGIGRATAVRLVAEGASVYAVDLDFSYYGRIRSLMGEGHPEQIAGVIAFAASDDASHLTGTELRVDGGSHI